MLVSTRPMEPLPSESLAPYVGILIWRQNFTGREVFVIEHGEQVVLPKGPLDTEEGEAAAATRLAAVFAGSRISNLRHLCTDHPEVQALQAKIIDRKLYSYGFNPQAEIRGVNVRMTPEGSTFDVEIDAAVTGEEKVLRDVFLPMIGQHNVQNALSSIAIAIKENIPDALIKKALSEFGGVKRRFTKTGEVNGINIIDDYGHHPVEIAAVLKSARTAVEKSGAKIHAIMQPHRYTRLHDLMDDFCTCFNDADSVLIADVYAASETPIEGADKEHLVAGIKKYGHKDVNVLNNSSEIAQLMSEKAKAGDFIIFLGAGDITKWAYALPAEMEELSEASKKKQA